MNKYFKIRGPNDIIYYMVYHQDRSYGTILKVEDPKGVYETGLLIGSRKRFYEMDSLDVTDEKTINELDKLMVFQ